MDASRAKLEQALKAYSGGQIQLAERFVREALELDPRNVEGLFSLGMISAAKGDTSGGIHCMRQALKVDPQYVPALDRLAVLLFQAGDFAGAELQASMCLAVDPKNTKCLSLRARCLAQSARLVEALELFRQAADLQRTPGAKLELSELLGSLNRYEDSLEAALQAHAAEPGSLRTNLQCARALTQLGRLEEAERHWKVAERVEERPGQIRLAQALDLALSGHLAAAEQAALEAIERDPKRGKPYYVLFNTRSATEADSPVLRRMEKLLADPSAPRSDRVDLLYALGKACNDLAEYEQAMRWFDRANLELRELNRPGYVFDREAFRQSIDARIATFASAPSDVEEAEIPIFVVGMIRSGTTLVDQILSAHADVGSAGEQPFWLVHHPMLLNAAQRTWDRTKARDLRAKYLQILATMSPSSSRVIDKNPGNVLAVGILSDLFPGAKTVCTARHAVDTALSIWMTQIQTNAPFVGDKSDIVFAYRQILRLIEHWQQVIPPDRFRVFRYEAMASEPESQTRELLEFCGLDWDEACLRPELNSRIVRTPSFWQVRQPIYRSSVDRWRRYERCLGPFEELVGL